MKRQHQDELQEPPAIPSLVAVFLLSAAAGLLLFNSAYAQGAHAALAAMQHAAEAASQEAAKTAAAAAAAAAAASRPSRPPDLGLQLLLETRVCGSPAVDGYAHVDPKCLRASPTARWYREWASAGGDPSKLVVHLEPASDIDGIAVKWGIGNKYLTPEECAKDCWAHRPGKVEGPFQDLPCNAFSWCGDPICFEPDAHNHTQGDCWLKWTEAPASPELNMRGNLPPQYRTRHPTAPGRVQWVAGVLLPQGVNYTNGSWSPRWGW